jgi:hypothetical protein
MACFLQLERVPPRMFLKHQLPEPLPQELINVSLIILAAQQGT